MKDQPTTLGYSSLTGTVYTLAGPNRRKKPVPLPELVAVISGWLHDHDLTVTQDDGTRVRYVETPDADVSCLHCGKLHPRACESFKPVDFNGLRSK